MFPSPNSPPLSRPRTSWCHMYSSSMGSQWTSCRTGALSSTHRSGEPFAQPSGHQPASPPAITPRPTDRRSELIRIWRPPCAVFPPDTPSPGPLIYPGWSTRITPWSAPPLVCHLSWSLMVFSPPCFPNRRRRLRSHPSRNTCDGAAWCGELLVLPSSAPRRRTNAWRTDIARRHPPTPLVRRCGSPPETSHSRLTQRNWRRGILVPSK